jgi:small-conductance mechanosensitive channel
MAQIWARITDNLGQASFVRFGGDGVHASSAVSGFPRRTQSLAMEATVPLGPKANGIARFLPLLCALILALSGYGAAEAQQPAKPPSEAAQAQALHDRLERAEAVIANPKSRVRVIEDQRDAIRAARADSAALNARLAQPRAAAKAAIEALGPAPAAGAPPEPDAVAAQRSELEAHAADIDAAGRLADVNIATANQLLDRVAEIERRHFLERAFEVRASALQPSTWVTAAEGLRDAARFTSAAVGSWIAEREKAGTLGTGLGVLGLTLLLAIGIVFPLRRRMLSWFAKLAASGRLGADPRELGAGLRMLVRIAVVVGSALLLIAVAHGQGLTEPPLGMIAGAALLALVLTAVADAVTRAWFAPANAALRLSRVRDDAQARRIWLRTLVLAFVASAGWAGRLAADKLEAPTEVLDAFMAIEGLVGSIALLLLSLSVRRIGNRPESIPWGRMALAVAGATAFAASLAGYGAFARLLIERVTAIALATLAFRVGRAFVHGLVLGVIAPQLRKTASTDDEIFLFWTRLCLDAVLVLIAAPLFASILGFHRSDIFDFLERAALGVRIGPIRLSLTSLAAAAAIFVAVLLVTRFLQRALSQSVLPRTRMDSGARNSIVALVGYAGLAIGGLTAIATAGVDLTNFAIIAGALSVGAGLGLQGFVANFVSGLTLLFERPFKIGDWIVLPDNKGQGIVKKIGMRATEVETFDRATIVVPNANLLTNVFTNWTLRDRTGRLTIPVGISYEADPELVQRLLLDIAKAHPETMTEPAPFVFWKDFGDNALIFEVQAHIADVGRTLRVQNDLRFAIWRVLKAHDIKIPYPHRVIHMAADAGAPKSGT